jgi:hypothetical protein
MSSRSRSHPPSAAKVWVERERRLRFTVRKASWRRIPFPIIIELWMDGGVLHMSRAQGPQHGATPRNYYAFERV